MGLTVSNVNNPFFLVNSVASHLIYADTCRVAHIPMTHNGAGLNGTNTFAHDYPTMGTALRNSGRDIVYSCSWLVFAFNHSFTEYGNLRLFSVVQNSHKTLLAGDAQGLTALFETSRQIRVYFTSILMFSLLFFMGFYSQASLRRKQRDFEAVGWHYTGGL